MAEPFSIAAGALTAIDLTAKLISKCRHLIETTRDAPHDLRRIFVEISSLKATLESLHCLSTIDSDFLDTIRGIDGVDEAVKGCNNTVESLAAELNGLAISQSSQTTPGKRQMLKGSLNWCLKESKVCKLLEAIQQHKSTISLALLSDVSRDIKEMKGDIALMREDLSESKQREVCHWLERNNPTLDHNNAQKLHEEQTSQWISRLNQYKQWLAGSHRFLWIYGIPGAGKTILLSHIIEQTNVYCTRSRGLYFCLYYYCSYRHTGDQTSAFLRWMVSQLCRKLKIIPQEVWEFYQSNTEPQLAQLKRALEILLNKVGRLYILLDAVDECDTRSDLLQLVTELVTDPAFAKIRILATSRQYSDIEHALGPLSESVSMRNPLVDEDIRIYVDSELHNNPKFRRWPDNLVDEILEALVAGAKGMFRWAACQLYILQRKRCESDLRKALTELPETLDETYEKILLDIPRSEWPYVRTALLWICAHECLPFKIGIPANCLASAVFSHDHTCLTSESHAYDSEILYELCGCLIRTYTSEPRGFLAISLAHYTVKEFLYSDRISKNSVSYFSTSERTTAHEYLSTVFKACSHIDLEKPPGYLYDNYQDYCREIGRIALIFWKDIFIQDENLWNLQIRFLDSPYYPPSGEILEPYGHNSDPLFSRFCWDSATYSLTPRDSNVFMRLLAYDDFQVCVKFLDGRDFEPFLHHTLLLCRWRGKHTHATMLEVIEREAYHSKSYETYHLFLRLCRHRLDSRVLFTSFVLLHDHEFACQEWGGVCYFDRLLTEGVNTNSQELVMTFLQIAVLLWDYHGTKLLLEKGADPNGIGNPNGREIGYLETRWGMSSPLHIIANADFAQDYYKEVRKRNKYPRQNRLKIRKVLIEYGARDNLVPPIRWKGSPKILRLRGAGFDDHGSPE